MDNFDEKIRQIKIFRQPASYLDDIFLNIKKYDCNNAKLFFPNSLFFSYKGELYIEINKEEKILYYNEKLYFKLLTRYKCSKTQIEKLINEKISHYFYDYFFDYNDILIDNGGLNQKHFSIVISLAC